MTFTTSNWSTPQTVTVTGVNDAAVDGTQSYTIAIGPATSTDANYAGRDPADLSFTNADNDAAGLVASPSSGLVTTEAGGSATFQLTLSSQPTANVVVAVSSSDTGEGTVSPASVTFTTANWNVPQTITVTGVNDLVDDGSQSYAIAIGPSSSTDPSYGGFDPGDLTFTNTDDDTAGLVANPSSGLVTTERGGTATFQLSLSSQPLADVVVAISSSDATEGTVSPASVTFTTANWNLAQTVTVTGVADPENDEPSPYTVQLSASSTDPSYDLAAASISVTNNRR